MGETLGHLHEALATIPAGTPPVLPGLEAIEEQLRSLLAAARGRRGNPVDEIAEAFLEAKLELLATIERIPALAPQWTHGDYEWRNVLFDDHDEVVAVIDFDAAQFYSPARDVMRCIALSFPELEPEADDFFRGYAVVRRLMPDDVREYVEFYRYISTMRFWPITNRYQHPERYRPEWDALIQPYVAWDWRELTDRLIDVVAEVQIRD
jgi:Ser/Thr protein kinase RdoA (MazF antagonist)